jgi:hypothetical protein
MPPARFRRIAFMGCALLSACNPPLARACARCRREIDIQKWRKCWVFALLFPVTRAASAFAYAARQFTYPEALLRPLAGEPRGGDLQGVAGLQPLNPIANAVNRSQEQDRALDTGAADRFDERQAIQPGRRPVDEGSRQMILSEARGPRPCRTHPASPV